MCGELQGSHSVRSSRHWKVVPGSGGDGSPSARSALKVNVTSLSAVAGSGPVMMNVSGAPSVVQV